MPKSLAERLARKLDRSAGPKGCWVWCGGRDSHGYGMIRVGGVQRGAHRVAWELSNAAVIPDGKKVLHSCDNPPCCNPAHLTLGSQAENVSDMLAKGRQVVLRGERNGRAIFSDETVKNMRSLYARGSMTMAEVGCVFGVTVRGTAYQILTGRRRLL